MNEDLHLPPLQPLANPAHVARCRAHMRARKGPRKPCGATDCLICYGPEPPPRSGVDAGIAEPAPYPAEWTAEQRLRAYWHALRRRMGLPGSAAGWELVLREAERHRIEYRELSPTAPTAAVCTRCNTEHNLRTLDRAGLCASCRLDSETEFARAEFTEPRHPADPEVFAPRRPECVCIGQPQPCHFCQLAQ